ncbi:MAG: hypothetical protein O9292_11290 [Rhodobacteraceae bacterium]|jgi:hypothetical protein|nr:hypothetical protein [Paracoccaceae bacterium]
MTGRYWDDLETATLVQRGGVSDNSRRLLTGNAKQSEGPAQRKRVGILAKDYDHFLGIAALLNSRDREVLFSNRLLEPLDCVLNHPHRWEAVVLKFDDFGTVSSLFEFITRFRLRRPSITLVLASSEFGSDDIGSERLPLCDACVRLPAGIEAFHAVLLAAKGNNELWVERCIFNY